MQACGVWDLVFLNLVQGGVDALVKPMSTQHNMSENFPAFRWKQFQFFLFPETKERGEEACCLA